MIACDTFPVTAITATKTTTVTTLTGTNIGFSTPHDDINPTPAGINITGMISIKNFPVSFTASSFIIPNTSPANKRTIP